MSILTFFRNTVQTQVAFSTKLWFLIIPISYITVYTCSSRLRGRGNSTVVSVSVCQAGRPGSHPARSACFRKVEFYQGAIDLFPPVLMTSSTKAINVLSFLCDHACKRSLAICHKIRVSCPVSRLLSIPILYSLHVLNRIG